MNFQLLKGKEREHEQTLQGLAKAKVDLLAEFAKKKGKFEHDHGLSADVYLDELNGSDADDDQGSDVTLSATGTLLADSNENLAFYLHFLGLGIAQWQCVGLTVLLEAVSWVRSSSEEKFYSRMDFSLEVNSGSDSISTKLFWMRV